MNRVILASVIALLAFLPAPVVAQQRPGPPARQQMEERIRQRFGEMVRRELGLSEDQLVRVQQVESSFQAQRRGLLMREAELRRQLRRQGEARTPEQARALLDEMAAVRDEEAELFRGEMDALLQVLTADQLLRFYGLRDDLMERVRRVRQGALDRPFPGGPRGPGPPIVPAALTSPLGRG